MDFSIENSIRFTLVALTGLSAGLCFTWSNAITPGIGKLQDLDYLMAFQQMNKAILNLAFFVVFFGPLFLGLISLFIFKNESVSIFWMYRLSFIIYFLGVVLVTVFGNVPLNEILSKTDLSSSSSENLKILRNVFEEKWNRLHFIRTLSAITSFLLLLLNINQSIK